MAIERGFPIRKPAVAVAQDASSTGIVMQKATVGQVCERNGTLRGQRSAESGTTEVKGRGG